MNGIVEPMIVNPVLRYTMILTNVEFTSGTWDQLTVEYIHKVSGKTYTPRLLGYDLGSKNLTVRFLGGDPGNYEIKIKDVTSTYLDVVYDDLIVNAFI